MLTHYNICNNCLQLDGLDGEADYPEDGRRIAAVLPVGIFPFISSQDTN